VAGVALSKITLEKEAHFDESRYARATAFQIDGWRSFCAAARDYAERASTLLTVRTHAGPSWAPDGFCGYPVGLCALGPSSFTPRALVRYTLATARGDHALPLPAGRQSEACP
jgi:hypothetical protein